VATVSGSGNVAQYTVEKLIEFGAKPVTLSDSGGTIVDEDGIDAEKLAWVMDLRTCGAAASRSTPTASRAPGSCPVRVPGA